MVSVVYLIREQAECVLVCIQPFVPKFPCNAAFISASFALCTDLLMMLAHHCISSRR